MNDMMKCPHCGKTFPITEAIKHQVKEEFEREQKPIMWKKALAAAESRKNEQSFQEIKLLKEELEEKKKREDQFIKNEIEIRREKAKLEEEKKELELKTQRKLDEERKKIADESYKKAIEENHFKNLEHEKKESSYLKQIEELKQKMEQGSQQTQGDVVEEELKNILTKEFPYDEITDVPTGIRGGDLIHRVRNNFGKDCGIILWEAKQRKDWSDSWVIKLKEDQRTLNADLAVIVTRVLPRGVKNFSNKNKVWVTNYDSTVGLAMVLRESLVRIAATKNSEVNKKNKMEILWNYLNGIEFQHRMEAIADVYNQMQEELEIEKRWFTKKWSKQEKNIRQVIDSISGMEGDLKAITGKALRGPEESKKLEPGENET